MVLIKQQCDNRVSRRIIDLRGMKGTQTPIALLCPFVERQIQMFFDLSLERVPLFAAAPCRQQGVMNRRGVDLKMPRESNRIEDRVVHNLCRGVQFKRLAKNGGVQLGERINNGEAAVMIGPEWG